MGKDKSFYDEDEEERDQYDEGSVQQVMPPLPPVPRETEETPSESSLALKDISVVAQEVLEGKWGVGQERRLSISEAGYDLKAVEAEVSRLLNRR